jgi:molybdopterin molybdotransferase
MLSYDEALKAILASADASPSKKQLALLDAVGRYAALEITAPIAVPSFDNSAMDGYAVRVGDVGPDKPLLVSQRIAAGDSAKPLAENTVARIFTGAMLPSNANAVIVQENAKFDAKNNTVSFSAAAKIGANIRRAGEDVAQSAQIVAKGERLDAAKIGLLASVGIADLSCFKPLRVAFFSTGSELKSPGDFLSSGEIYNSNRYALLGALSAIGVKAIDLGVCPDSPEKTREMLKQASLQADCIITTGGMSVGDEDYVYQQAKALGEIDFWKIAIKPGKPLAFGHIGEACFFGLPGNPVSSFLTFYLFVVPWLRKRSGALHVHHVSQQAVAQFDYSNSRGKRREFLRGRLEYNAAGQGCVAMYSKQGSGVFSSIDYANVLIPVPAGGNICSGDLLPVLRFSLTP